MGNYRLKLRGLGCPELHVNSLKKKQAHEKAPAKNIKNQRKAVLNYLLPQPQAEAKGSLEHERAELLNEVKKRNIDWVIISENMAKTFLIRRQEVVNQAPPVNDLKDRWPALFDAQVNIFS